jgi:DNA-directed RNA polymerase delta subunit
MSDSISIFDRIIEVEKTKRLHGFDVEEEVAYVFSCPKIKKERDKDVLTARFGLTSEQPKTLEEIGRSLSVTRERVRQIEKTALRKLIVFANQEKKTGKAFQIIKEQVDKQGGIVSLEKIYEIFIGANHNNKVLQNKLKFFLGLDKDLIKVNETALLKAGVSSQVPTASIEEIVKAGIKILEQTNKPVEEKEFLKKLAEEVGEGYRENTLASAIDLAKNIIKTEEGHLGLSHWREINPKSIRDKTYYVLKKNQKPLHFEEIAIHIEKLDEGKKKVTKQAVHNELIRDDRFILIGRGIYALREWGYTSGVVEKVIEDILREAGKPMHKDEIIEEVKKRRIVKETTILLNLQKDKFVRVARATYTVKQGG